MLLNKRGKEYKYEQVIFEGIYKEGKRHGKGKEYFLNKENVKKRNEKIEKEKNKEYKVPKLENTEYYENGNLKFEGEYLEGKKWNGKGFNEEGKEVFEIKNGNGKVKDYGIDGELIFEGKYLDGEKWNGKGKEYNESGELIFEGEYLNGRKWNGKGKNIILMINYYLKENI